MSARAFIIFRGFIALAIAQCGGGAGVKKSLA
jgi:hypothetical protein